MIGKIRDSDFVLCTYAKTSTASSEREVVVNSQRTGVEQHVMVGTKAENIVLHIWASAWCPKATNMCRLCVRTSRCLQPSAAYLACVIVNLFHAVCDLCAANDSLNELSRD